MPIRFLCSDTSSDGLTSRFIKVDFSAACCLRLVSEIGFLLSLVLSAEGLMCSVWQVFATSIWPSSACPSIAGMYDPFLQRNFMWGRVSA